VSQLGETLSELRSVVSESSDAVSAEMARIDTRIAEVRRIAAASLDDIPHLRHQLLGARSSEAYEEAFRDPEPLITIRIPTYVRSDLLVERALPSIVRQTYQNFEVIVVVDGCTNDVAKRIDDFGDPRVRFVNLPYRYPYPEDRQHRWSVAGAPGVNVGTELARGTWLAMLGDDDEFEPHHLECLLEHARSTRSEMVYGDLILRHPPPGADEVLARYPPEVNWFNFQGALFMAALRFYEFSTRSWLLNEPSDWNLCRRMLESGVRIGHVDRVVTVFFPSHYWEPETRGL
jgi:glycosyltransferase involved in cell wall biosynthesis